MSKTLDELASQVRETYDADIILFFGPVARPKDDFLMDECLAKKKHPNVIFHVTTYGGDANPAYRIARALQKRYSPRGGSEKPGKFYAFVNSVCASAGTLLVMGADELILSHHAELGPIDVQLRKADEVGERTSGLTPVQALQSLSTESIELFRAHFTRMRFDLELGFPTSLASKIAAELSAGLIGKLYEQIDPMRVAEINRFLKITEEYGKRISRNLKSDGLQRLLVDYPAHDFVIDPQEARDLFCKVSEPDPVLEELGSLLKPIADRFLNASAAQVTYLPEATNHESKPKPTRKRARKAAGTALPKPLQRTPLPERRRHNNTFPKAIYTKEVAEQEQQSAEEFQRILAGAV